MRHCLTEDEQDSKAIPVPPVGRKPSFAAQTTPLQPAKAQPRNQARSAVLELLMGWPKDLGITVGAVTAKLKESGFAFAVDNPLENKRLVARALTGLEKNGQLLIASEKRGSLPRTYSFGPFWGM